MSRKNARGPVFNGTDLTILGLRVIVVRSWPRATPSSWTRARCYGVVRSDPRIEVNRQSDAAWTRYGRQVRVITGGGRHSGSLVGCAAVADGRSRVLRQRS